MIHKMIHKNGHTMSTLNKQKETKLKKENIKKKYGEYQNVFFTEEQYEKLKQDFPNDYKNRIQNLDDYMQSSGKKYKDCLATIRNWARKEGYKIPCESKPKQSEFKELDIDDLTEEEYMQVVRGERNV